MAPLGGGKEAVEEVKGEQEADAHQNVDDLLPGILTFMFAAVQLQCGIAKIRVMADLITQVPFDTLAIVVRVVPSPCPYCPCSYCILLARPVNSRRRAQPTQQVYLWPK